MNLQLSNRHFAKTNPAKLEPRKTQFLDFTSKNLVVLNSPQYQEAAGRDRPQVGRMQPADPSGEGLDSSHQPLCEVSAASEQRAPPHRHS